MPFCHLSFGGLHVGLSHLLVRKLWTKHANSKEIRAQELKVGFTVGNQRCAGEENVLFCECRTSRDHRRFERYLFQHAMEWYRDQKLPEPRPSEPLLRLPPFRCVSE